MGMTATERRKATCRTASAKYRATAKGKATVNAYRQSADGKARRVKSDKVSKARYPDKQRARDMLNKRVGNGAVVKPDVCQHIDSQCSGRLHAHHDDYDQPLEVVWLCVYHHRRLHAIYRGLSYAAR
jgi:hypothetical protein